MSGLVACNRCGRGCHNVSNCFFRRPQRYSAPTLSHLRAAATDGAYWELVGEKAVAIGTAAHRCWHGGAHREQPGRCVSLLCHAPGRGTGGCELYLPEEWAAYGPRRRTAAVPEETESATKPELARRMIERALKTGGACPLPHKSTSCPAQLCLGSGGRVMNADQKALSSEFPLRNLSCRGRATFKTASSTFLMQ